MGGGSVSGVTYQGTIRGLVERDCTICHFEGTGTAPFSLASWADVEAAKTAVVAAVASRAMPPYLPRDGCREMQGVPVFPEEAIDAFLDWERDGYLEGDPGDYRGPAPGREDPLPALGPPSLIFAMPKPYQPAPASPDITTEWLLPASFDEDTWVLATEIGPGAPSIVHHATAFLETDGTPAEVPVASAIVGAYAPGYAPLRFPTGSALFVPAGAAVRLLVHFSTVGIAPGEPVPEDRSELRLWTLPAGTAPDYQAFFDSVSNGDLFIPANEAHVEVTEEHAVPHPDAPIVGIIPHMHLLGVAFHAELLRPDGAVDCLVDEPHYGFLHQSLLMFAPGAEAPVSVEDALSMTCVYDNSQANQPIVDGHPKISVDVGWGDASTDEMCNVGLLRIVALDGP